MNFTEKDLVLVRDALKLAIAEVHNEIATCPDIYEYEENIIAWETTEDQLKKLLERVEKKL